MSVMSNSGPTILLRHAVATLAYRALRAAEKAPAEFGEYGDGPGARTPGHILAHMGDLMDWAVSLVDGQQKWQDSSPLAWPDEVARFFQALRVLDDRLAATELDGDLANRLFQGPIADALTHTGQLAMLRRIAGCPIRGENYFVAEITAGRAGVDQAPPRKPFL